MQISIWSIQEAGQGEDELPYPIEHLESKNSSSRVEESRVNKCTGENISKD